MGKFEQRVGSTRSAKAILQPVNIDDKTLAALTSEYRPDDHFDAYALFQYLTSRELVTNGEDSPRIVMYDRLAYFHAKKLGEAKLRLQRSSLGLITIFDIIEFGKRRADAVFP